MSDYDPIIPQPRTASATLNKALATYEDILVDALLAQHGGRNRLRLLGDEDLHRARLAIWREQVTADEWFADIPDPVLAISRVMALGMARQAVAREEERRERARQFHNVPRDPASAFVDEAIVAAIKDRLTPEEWARQINLTELRSLPGGKAVGRCPFSDPWPAPPDDAAYHGLAGDIVRELLPHTEADPMALLVTLLACVGNAIGTGPHYRVSGARHELRIFPVLVGATASGRKGTALDTLGPVFEAALPEWWARRTKGLVSGEGLIYHVRDEVSERRAVKSRGVTISFEDMVSDAGVSDKRLLVIEKEFGGLLKVLARENNTLSAVIRDAWDGGHLATLAKHSGDARHRGAHHDPGPHHAGGADGAADEHRGAQRLREPLPLALRRALEAPAARRRPRRRHAPRHRRGPQGDRRRGDRAAPAAARRRGTRRLGARLRGPLDGRARRRRRAAEPRRALQPAPGRRLRRARRHGGHRPGAPRGGARDLGLRRCQRPARLRHRAGRREQPVPGDDPGGTGRWAAEPVVHQ
jgi:hypothetical protein